MTTTDILAIGNAIVDVIATVDDATLMDMGYPKGSMQLIDEDTANRLYADMTDTRKVSGGSAANSAAGMASLGGTARFIGKVAGDDLGISYRADLTQTGVQFDTPALADGLGTGRCLVYVTPDAERTMCTFLGAANQLHPDDIDGDAIANAQYTLLEGYLFDPEDAKRAFHKAADLSRKHNRQVALSLSDTFCVHNHRAGFQEMINNQVNILFANEAEMMAMAETDNFDRAVEYAKSLGILVALTRSEKGSLIIAQDEVITVDAKSVDQVMDTTGAGDLYAAGFLFGMTRARPLADCGHIASLAAAEVISHYGARPEIKLASLLETA